MALYLPRAPSQGASWGLDKLVHAALFGVVLWAGVYAGVRARPLAWVLLGHAVLSEALQEVALPNRSGDWRDVLADAAGVLLVLWWVRGRPRGQRTGSVPLDQPG